MRKVILLFFWGALGISGNSQGPNALTWDATNKEYHAQAGETQTTFTFRLTNSAPSEISILNVSSSCGCAVVNLPTRPWKIEPGKDGELQVKVDFRGKRGTLSKTAIVQASTGPTVLMFTVTIPEAAAMNAAQRERNIALAQADRQAVFKSNCASCHAEPVKGKMGASLYAAACGICHEAEHRASMVPDLRTFKHPGTGDYWRGIIAHGKPGTLMPAFAQTEGGPLDEAQIKSLVEFLSRAFPPGQPANTSR